MADVLAFNLTQAKAHSPRKFKRPDLSTKLKLLGVEVASFGDFFADRDGPKEMPGRRREIKSADGVKSTQHPSGQVKALTYKDPFQQVYKKYLFTTDGKYLLGGMMIGDTKDYVKLVPMVVKQTPLEIPPSELIVGANKGDDDGADLFVLCICLFSIPEANNSQSG
jgi:nitrite reductase (NAD(P)H)